MTNITNQFKTKYIKGFLLKEASIYTESPHIFLKHRNKKHIGAVLEKIYSLRVQFKQLTE